MNEITKFEKNNKETNSYRFITMVGEKLRVLSSNPVPTNQDLAI